MACATRGAHSRSSCGVGREQLDLHRLGRVRQIADHVLQHLHELDFDAGLLLRYAGAQFGDDLIDIAAGACFSA